MAEHTKEPWTWDQQTSVSGPEREPVATFWRAEDVERAVACVNACAGLSPPGVPKLVEACEDLLPFNNCFEPSEPSGLYNRVHAVLDALKVVKDG